MSDMATIKILDHKREQKKKLPHTISSSRAAASGGTVLKAWTKDINCFFFSVNAIGKKRRLYFFHFTRFGPGVCVNVGSRHTEPTQSSTAAGVCATIACSKHPNWVWSHKIGGGKRRTFLFCFIFHSSSYCRAAPRTAPKPELHTEQKLYIPSWVGWRLRARGNF